MYINQGADIGVRCGLLILCNNLIIGKGEDGQHFLSLCVEQRIIVLIYIRLVCLLDLAADFGVKANAKLTPNCQLPEKIKTVLRAVHTQ